jgi:uncharacterized protein YukE
MADFEYNSEAFTTAINEYKSARDTIQTVKTNLAAMAENLHTTDWRSKAGEEFNKQYNSSWVANVDRYLATIDFIISCLTTAQAEFDKLVEEADKIQYTC